MNYKSALIILILACCLTRTEANTDERIWTLETGEKIRAAQLSYDRESGDVILLIDDSTERAILFDNYRLSTRPGW